MTRSIASMLVVLACAGTAYAEDVPSHVKPFLSGSEDGVHTVTGAFGPAKDTTVVVTFSMVSRGSFSGFALAPDAKAKHGQRKLALPKIPGDSMDGAMKTALVANLDKDANDELVLELKVMRSVNSPHGGYTYSTFEYVVLDWDGKKLVRLAPLEKKLAAKMESREDHLKANALTEDDVRAALGVAKQK